MKLYAFQPRGHGEQSFFTIAKNEEEAVKAVERYIIKKAITNAHFPWEAAGWGTDYYKMTVLEEGEVVENDNQ